MSLEEEYVRVDTTVATKKVNPKTKVAATAWNGDLLALLSAVLKWVLNMFSF